MRSTFYDLLGLGSLLGGGFFYYRCAAFLAEKDYIAAAMVLVAGFLVMRMGVELTRLAVVLRREENRM